MKNLSALVPTVAALLALSACGGSKPFCDRQKEAFDTALGTMGDCSMSKAMMEANRPDDTKCEANYADCSASDKAVLDDSIACLSELPKCTKDTEATTWASAALKCRNKSSSLPTACLKITWPPFCKVQATALTATLGKVTDCDTMKSAMEAGMPPAGKCDTVYPKCTAADQAVLDDMIRCLTALPVCTPETESDTWAPAAMACQDKANSLTSECMPITQP
ncbi:MAG: hypothetical protein QM765_46180 [Myxococcales bacterium]